MDNVTRLDGPPRVLELVLRISPPYLQLLLLRFFATPQPCQAAGKQASGAHRLAQAQPPPQPVEAEVVESEAASSPGCAITHHPT
jgi:hypothetical protein